jgi:hypothetical protein
MYLQYISNLWFWQLLWQLVFFVTVCGILPVGTLGLVKPTVHREAFSDLEKLAVAANNLTKV